MQKDSINFVDDAEFEERIDLIRRLFGKDQGTFFHELGISNTSENPFHCDISDNDGGNWLELVLMQEYGINPNFFLDTKARLFIKQGRKTPMWVYIMYHMAFPRQETGTEELKKFVTFKEYLEKDHTTNF